MIKMILGASFACLISSCKPATSTASTHDNRPVGNDELMQAVAAAAKGDLAALEICAERGDLEACYNLAKKLPDQKIHQQGEHRSMAQERAWRLYLRAGQGGYVPAQLELGLRLSSAPVLDAERLLPPSASEVDPDLGFAWYMKAALQGDASARFCVASCYLSGRGVERNSNEAMKWLTLNAGAKHAMSLRYLGQLYLHGADQIEKDPERAVKNLVLALSLGDLGAAPDLARCYHGGTGCSKDLKMTSKLIEISLGHKIKINGLVLGQEDLPNLFKSKSRAQICKIWGCELSSQNQTIDLQKCLPDSRIRIELEFDSQDFCTKIREI